MCTGTQRVHGDVNESESKYGRTGCALICVHMPNSRNTVRVKGPKQFSFSHKTLDEECWHRPAFWLKAEIYVFTSFARSQTSGIDFLSFFQFSLQNSRECRPMANPQPSPPPVRRWAFCLPCPCLDRGPFATRHGTTLKDTRSEGFMGSALSTLLYERR